MQIEVGDIVQLTGTCLLFLKQNSPGIYKRITDVSVVDGEVVSIQQNQIAVNFRKAFTEPLVITCEGNPHVLLQIVKKANSKETKPYAIVDVEVPADFAVAEDAELHDEEFYEGETGGDGVYRTTVTPDEEIIPANVKLAQWFVTQTIDLKKYAITQDLQRVDDNYGDEPLQESEEYFKANRKNFRPVSVELCAQEELTYHAALKAIRDCIVPKTTKVQDDETADADVN